MHLMIPVLVLASEWKLSMIRMGWTVDLPPTSMIHLHRRLCCASSTNWQRVVLLLENFTRNHLITTCKRCTGSSFVRKHVMLSS